MKKRDFVLFCFLAAMLLTVCGCGASDNDTASEPETVKEKVYYAAFEVPKGWKEKMVDPYPSEAKFYQYDGEGSYKVSFVKTDSIDTLEKECEELLFAPVSDLEKTEGIQVERKDAEMGGQPAKQIVVTFKADGDLRKKDHKWIITGMETRIGAYFVQGTGINSEKRQAAYDEVLDSFTITDKMDEEVYAQNTGQAGELLFPLSGWVTRTETYLGMVSYSTEEDTIRLIPLKEDETADEAINRAYRENDFYEAERAWAKEVKNKTIDKGKVVRMKTSAGGESNRTSITGAYILNIAQNQEGKDVCVVLSSYEKQKKFPYPEMLRSFQSAELAMERVNTLWENRTKYAGDNSKARTLSDGAGFGDFGTYTIKLVTEKEPYGMILQYEKPLSVKTEEQREQQREQLTRQAGIVLGLVENLEFVEIQSNGEKLRVTEDDANCLRNRNIKKLGQEKAQLTDYVLEGMWNGSAL